jgi:hypothetical protein
MQEPRPSDRYFLGYVETDSFRQGDIFADTPFPFPAMPEEVFDVVAVEKREETDDDRLDLLGRTRGRPCDFRNAVLVSPDAHLSSADPAGLVLTLMPIRRLAELQAAGRITNNGLVGLRAYDDRLPYMYLPEDDDFAMEESVLCLHESFSLTGGLIERNRIARMTSVARQQLRRKLVDFFTSRSMPRAQFPG